MSVNVTRLNRSHYNRPGLAMDFIDTLTKQSLTHRPYCECVVCRAASGDREAIKQAALRHRAALPLKWAKEDSTSPNVPASPEANPHA